MLVPFCEKTYEKYVACELAAHTRYLFSPDQNSEAILGFDDGYLMPIHTIGSFAPYISPARRRNWKGLMLNELGHLTERVAHYLPPFKLNLFLQYKRPKHMKRASASEWNFWNDKYYRYSITPHQQTVLEKLDQQSAGRATTLYASAAFHTSKRLFDFAVDGLVTQNSNFANIARLTGHGKFTYQVAGSFGIACSEPTPIESEGLAIFGEMERFETLPLDQHLLEVAKTIELIIQKGSRFNRDLFAAARRALEFDVTRPSRTFSALKTITGFCDAFDTSYYAAS